MDDCDHPLRCNIMIFRDYAGGKAKRPNAGGGALGLDCKCSREEVAAFGVRISGRKEPNILKIASLKFRATYKVAY